MCRSVCTALLLAALTACLRQARGAAEHEDLPPSHSVKPELFATGFEIAQGPALDADGALFVCNYRGNGNIGKITPDGTASVLCVLNELAPIEGRSPQANGIKIDGQGRLVVADVGGGRLLQIAPDGSTVEVLADRFESERFDAVYDVALDTAGNIYFTDAGRSNPAEPVGSVYRYDVNTKRVSRLAAALAFPTGVGLSPSGLGETPEQKKKVYLCVAESQKRRILIYDCSPDGKIGKGRVLIELPAASEGIIEGGRFLPGGFVFDTKGRLFVAMGAGAVIDVVEVPSGKLVRQYEAGGRGATNCHFHGPFLYTTIAAKEAVFRLKLGVQGFAYSGTP